MSASVTELRPMRGDVADPAAAAVPRAKLASAMAAILAFLRHAPPAPRERPLARVRARHAALGFPYRRNPGPAPKRPERDCDCVPLSWP